MAALTVWPPKWLMYMDKSMVMLPTPETAWKDDKVLHFLWVDSPRDWSLEKVSKDMQLHAREVWRGLDWRVK